VHALFVVLWHENSLCSRPEAPFCNFGGIRFLDLRPSWASPKGVLSPVAVTNQSRWGQLGVGLCA